MKYVQTYFLRENFCALHVFLCVLISQPVCARAHAQPRGNIAGRAEVQIITRAEICCKTSGALVIPFSSAIMSMLMVGRWDGEGEDLPGQPPSNNEAKKEKLLAPHACRCISD